MSRSTVCAIRRAGIFAATRPNAAPRSSAPPPTMTKYCGTARDPSRRTLPWHPMVAVWGRPPPVGAAADLEAGAVRRGDEIRTSAQVLFEEPAEAARLRDRQAAGFRAG